MIDDQTRRVMAETARFVANGGDCKDPGSARLVDYLARFPAWVHRDCEPPPLGDAKPGDPRYLATISRMRVAHERQLEWVERAWLVTQEGFGAGELCAVCGRVIRTCEAATCVGVLFDPKGLVS